MILNENNIAPLKQLLINKLRQSIIAQKHVNNSKLLDSIKIKVINDTIEGYIIDYGKYVDSGRRAGARRVPIFALIEWAREKNLSLKAGQTYKNVAFAIQNAIYAKGIPSQPYVYWSEGNSLRRTGWMTDTLNDNEDEIKQFLFRIVGKQLQLGISNELTGEIKLIA